MIHIGCHRRTGYDIGLWSVTLSLPDTLRTGVLLAAFQATHLAGETVIQLPCQVSTSESSRGPNLKRVA